MADLCHDRTGAGDDALEPYLEKALEESSAGPEPSLTRYITATGLLAFGRGEMVEIILANVPEIPSEGVGGKVLYIGVNGLRALLPLPERLHGEAGWYTMPDVDGIRRWWRESRAGVQWDAALQRFVVAER